MTENRVSLPFEKISATGNRFLFVQSIFLTHFDTLDALRTLAIQSCKQHRVDGLVFWHGEKDVAPSLLIVNSDGSLAGTCGNALRAFAFVLRKRKIWETEKPLRVYRIWESRWNEGLAEDEVFASSAASFATLEKAVAKNAIQGEAQISMGVAKKATVVAPTSQLLQDMGVYLNGARFESVYVELANPHWVFVSRAFETFSYDDFVKFGQAAQGKWREMTKEDVPLCNIGMSVSTSNHSNFAHAVYERGAGFTQCCGSGSVAARIALETLGHVETNTTACTFEMPGGSVQVIRSASGYSLAGKVNWEEEGVL